MKNFIHLSPHFPPNYKNFSQALKSEGIQVFGLGDLVYDELDPGLKNALTAYYRVDDLHHYDQLVKALGYFTHHYGKIDGIDSHNEYWLETEAKLRTDFTIPGIKSAEIDQIKKKSAMKEIFRKAGLEVVEGIKVSSYQNALDFVNRFGFPLIAKPDSGVGAADTYKITNQYELKMFFNEKAKVPYFLEQFVEGQIQSFDGLVDKQGNLLFYTVHVNRHGVMEVVNENIHTYYYSLLQIPDDIIAAGKTAIKAFGLKGRFFHIEFFREKASNKLIALEVNMRPPGGFTMDMFNYACDADLYKTWAAMIANRQAGFEYQRKYHVVYVSRKQQYDYKFTQDALLTMFPDEIVFHSPLPEIMARAMGNHGFIIRGKSMEKLIEIQEQIQLLNQ
ncbi:MAG: ATP-grasp domain-containing protein [Bacteroidetes bacterium]|nr:ATP-grasp domain-containing protein [Bacteroidota bacterium]MBU1579898.1 ATP-grasp domain-containing protein [Bacteroidota bacterium]MBU2557776.1 ATP-grasp domain-containing protein [Bacteroidota bacterium]